MDAPRQKEKPGHYFVYAFYPDHPTNPVRYGTEPAEDPRAAMNRAKRVWPDAKKWKVSKSYVRPTRELFR